MDRTHFDDSLGFDEKSYPRIGQFFTFPRILDFFKILDLLRFFAVLALKIPPKFLRNEKSTNQIKLGILESTKSREKSAFEGAAGIALVITLRER